MQTEQQTTDSSAAPTNPWDSVFTQEVEIQPETVTTTEETEPTLTIEPEKPAQTTEPTTTTEEKPAETTEPAPADDILKLDVSDLKDVPKTYEEGTLQRLAQDLGVSVDKEDYEAVKTALKESFVSKSEFEKVQQSTTESLYEKLDPRIATAFKMIDLGIDPSMAFNPTSKHDYLLNLDSAELLRLKLEGTEGYDADMVDAQLEEWTTNDKLETLAKIEKANLAQEKQTILNTQSQLYNQLSEQRSQQTVKAKQESDQKFFEALNKESAFLGLPISKEVKAAIEAKYRAGSYDNVLSEAQSKVKSIMQHEFGNKFQEIALKKAEEKGKAEIVRKLSDVPTKKDFGGGRPTASQESDNKNPFADVFGT